MAFVTYSGHFADMSVPTTMGFTGYICIELLRFGFLPPSRAPSLLASSSAS